MPDNVAANTLRAVSATNSRRAVASEPTSGSCAHASRTFSMEVVLAGVRPLPAAAFVFCFTLVAKREGTLESHFESIRKNLIKASAVKHPEMSQRETRSLELKDLRREPPTKYRHSAS